MMKTIFAAIALLGLLLGTGTFFYKFGFKNGSEFMRPSAYTKGQVDLILSLDAEIGGDVNSVSKEDLYYFTDISDITVYIYEENGVKTFAIK